MKRRLLIQRRLPSPGKMLVKVGDIVKSETVIAKLNYVPGPLVQCDIAKSLGIAPSRLEAVLSKNEEDPIEQGEIIASNREFFSNRNYYSPASGHLALWSRYLGYAYIREILPTSLGEAQVITATSISLSAYDFQRSLLVEQGQIVARGQKLFRGEIDVYALATSRVDHIDTHHARLILLPLYHTHELKAYIDGRVVGFPEQDICSILGYGYSFNGALGYGGEGTGRLFPILEAERDLEIKDIPEDVENCIVVARAGMSISAFHHLIELKVSGLVLGSLHPRVLHSYKDQNPLSNYGIMIEVPFPIVVMSSFIGSMNQQTYNQLAALDGYKASISGKMQLRAGVLRPEILIPFGEVSSDDDIPSDDLFDTLAPGDQVLLIAEPHFGKIAKVLKVSSELKITDAGTRAPLAEIELENGLICQVPINNCTRHFS